MNKVEPQNVRLVVGKGSPAKGGGAGGHYWHIYTGEKRVGNVFINIVEDAILGKHASIQIHVNQQERSRGIGSVAYQLAAEQSGYNDVYAVIAKKNVASQKAARNAGFKELEDVEFPQILMVWNRHG
jgi:RimJ/RimL family protein N-acetyltransferase